MEWGKVVSKGEGSGEGVDDTLDGSRFWFWVPFLNIESRKNPDHLNRDYMTLLDLNWILGIEFFFWIRETSTFGAKSRNMDYVPYQCFPTHPSKY